MIFCYGYPDFPDANTSVDTLHIPEECMKAIKRSGIEYIGDMLDVYARVGAGVMDGFPRMSSKCISLIYREIITLEGCP